MQVKEKYLKMADEYLNNDVTMKYLCEKYNCHRTTLYNNFKKLGIKSRPTGRSQEKTDKLNKAINLYNSGRTIKSIANELNIQEKTISTYLDKNNIKKRNCNFDFIKDTYVNSNYFSIIDTEHKAYWLGFIYADGSIAATKRKHDLTIELNEIDLIHLKKFRNDLNSNIPIKKRCNRNTVTIRIGSIKMVEDLISYGCIPNKTYDGYFSNRIFNLSKDLKIAFLRGYLDGDGYIDKKRNRIIYTIKKLSITEDLSSIIKEVTDIDFKINNKKTYYQLSIENKKDFQKFLTIIYKDATIVLNRKYEIYKNRVPSQEEIPESIRAKLNGELLANIYVPNGTIVC